ncbi:unnamed protein product [Paramecium octaurelia]|uniref:Uncharacterized protein n=1 Tax=Paramecium octaurelia TaxID=43137 RepID=A0A8S1T315_PAROT|nr:unnamed protein product [Paramecium octaurelia]
MYSPKYPVDQSIVNIGSNPLKTRRAQSEFQPSNFQNQGNKQRTKNLVELLKDDLNIQYVEYPEELFQVPENSVALVPIQIMRDILKIEKIITKIQVWIELYKLMNIQNQQRQNNNDDCDCCDLNDCCNGCCCEDCCKDCECQECGCDCINTIQTNCCDNWQCCQCMQCCTAGDILTELNFNRHIELEDENETFLAQFKELISNYRIYKRYRHPLLEESFLLKKKKTSTLQFYDKIILKTYWFTNQNEYSKSLSVWHQNIFKYTEMQLYGARIQDICVDRWRIAVLLPKLHHIQKKHKFQVYTFLSQISSQILNYSEEKSIFNELLIYYDTNYVLLPSNLLKLSVYEQYRANHKLRHPPEWEDENEQIFDWNKSDCFLLGLFVLSQLVNSSLDDVYEESKFNKNKLNFYLQKINSQEFYNVLIYMLQTEPDERYSLQQILQLMKHKPITPITQDNNKSQAPLQSTQKQQPISVVSRVQNQNLNTGGVYTGDQIDNKKHGHGKLLNPDGSGYEGEWFQDLMHGKGELFLSDGRILYKGQFQNGKYHNFGHLINPNPNITQNYNFRDLRNIGNYWSKYEGDFKQDKKHGYGILYFSSGEKWAGEFVDDIPSGFGTFFGLSGEVTGKWVKGILFD